VRLHLSPSFDNFPVLVKPKSAKVKNMVKSRNLTILNFCEGG